MSFGNSSKIFFLERHICESLFLLQWNNLILLQRFFPRKIILDLLYDCEAHLMLFWFLFYFLLGFLKLNIGVFYFSSMFRVTPLNWDIKFRILSKFSWTFILLFLYFFYVLFVYQLFLIKYLYFFYILFFYKSFINFVWDEI